MTYKYSNIYSVLQSGYCSVQIDSSSRKIGAKWRGSLAYLGKHSNGGIVQTFTLFEKNLVKSADTLTNASDINHISTWREVNAGLEELEKIYKVKARIICTDHGMLFFNKLKKEHMRLNIKHIRKNTDEDYRVIIWCWIHRSILILKGFTQIEQFKWVFRTSRDIINLITNGIINCNILEAHSSLFQELFDIKQSITGFIKTRHQYMAHCFHLLIINRAIIMNTLKAIVEKNSEGSGKARELLKTCKFTFWWSLSICMSITYVFI